MDHILEIIRMSGKNYSVFCVMPFTEYEFQGDDGNLLNPDTLRSTSTSEATENNLIGTFADIEFESFKQEIPEARLATNL